MRQNKIPNSDEEYYPRSKSAAAKLGLGREEDRNQLKLPYGLLKLKNQGH